MTSPVAPEFGSRIDQSPIGAIEVRASSRGLTQVNLLGKHSVFQVKENERVESELTRQALYQILEYLEGERREFNLTVDWNCVTVFHHEVLALTVKIKFGELLTYGQLAREMGKPSASRAIGGAMARNPLPIIVPCHRVLSADGRLTGYSAADGIETKRWLLELEGHRIIDDRWVQV